LGTTIWGCGPEDSRRDGDAEGKIIVLMEGR
jgi:hypothetical protein